jgi:hypothetical protein
MVSSKKMLAARKAVDDTYDKWRTSHAALLSKRKRDRTSADWKRLDQAAKANDDAIATLYAATDAYYRRGGQAADIYRNECWQ